MMKSIIYKKLILFVFVLSLFSFSISFAEGKALGEERVLTVTGDSYAQHFYEDEKNNGVRLDVFAREGKTIDDNMEVILNSLNQSSRYVLFSISVNDAIRKTPINKFKSNLRKIFDRAMNLHKVIFVHTYVEYNFDGDVPNLVYPNQYDEALKEVAAEYSNVFYLDMGSFLSRDFFGLDTIHASKKFNDAVFSYIYIGLMPYLESQPFK